jgi:hypothetical protein
MNRTLITCVFLLCFKLSSAQEMWGFSNSNYSGNMGIFLNPSTIVGAPYNYEFNYLAADLFADNNYIYFPQSNNIVVTSIQGKQTEGKAEKDFFNTTPEYGFAHVLIIGPSFINSKRRGEAWGIHTAYRADISAQSVPPEVAKYIYERYKYSPFINQTFSVPGFKAALLNWYELGGTIGKVIHESEFGYWKGAATVNALIGTNGLYMDVKGMDFTVLDSSSVIVHKMDMTMASAMPQGSFGGLLAPRGLGASTTLGLTYMRKRKISGFECDNGADHIRKYIYRIGLSAVDFGFIRFFNSKSQITTIQSNTDHLIYHIDSIPFNSMSVIDNTLNNTVGSTVSTQKKGFSMFLPSAVSLQFDYSITNNLFANASIMNRVYFLANQVARSNSIAVSGRYEKRRWELNGNVTMFEYEKVSAGIGFRYGIFVVGTDRLLEFLNLLNVQTMDLFFGFRWQGCDLPWKNKKTCPAYKH